MGAERARATGWQHRRLLGLALLLLAIVVAAGYVYFFLWRPIGSGPAGSAVAAGPFQASWTERPVVVLGLGDSITAGFGADVGYSFFARLVENPPDEYPGMRGRSLRAAFPNMTVSNIAVNGSTSLDCVADQLPLLETHGPEAFGVVILTTGGNDIIHMYGRIPPREGAMYGATLEQALPWIENYERRLDLILDTIEAAFPGGCRIFLGNIYDPSDGLGDPTEAGLPAWPDVLHVLGAYNHVIARCAARRDRVTLVDIHGTFLGHGVACRRFWNRHYDRTDPHYWYYVNLEDPNHRGHDAIRRVFLNSIAEALPDELQERETLAMGSYPRRVQSRPRRRL
jgi:lysophospholipase L1-like esterase